MLRKIYNKLSNLYNAKNIILYFMYSLIIPIMSFIVFGNIIPNINLVIYIWFDFYVYSAILFSLGIMYMMLIDYNDYRLKDRTFSN